jgi:iron(III) transport system ATP-binding protein
VSALLNVSDIRVDYADESVVRGLSLHVNRGGLGCLLGPSGCGKTTTLRAIAGFEPVTRGEIAIDGRRVSAPGHTVAPERRRVGMVFQDNALFPHLSVEGNIGFGLRGRPAAERRRDVDEMMDVVGLKGLEGRYVHELSGGQQQRVALARALAPKPAVVLLDEPFSSLDADLRERLAREVRQILREREITALLVTHDQNEAFTLADQVGVMREGRLLQWDTAYNLYHEPRDRFVANFIGQGVFLRGKLVSPETVDTELGLLRGDRAYGWGRGREVDVLLRPDDIVPDPQSDIRATVRGRSFKGANILYALALPSGSAVLSLFPSHHYHDAGESVGIRVEADHLVVFPAG